MPNRPQRLRRLARERGTSMAALIRAAVDRTYPAAEHDSVESRWDRALAHVGGFHGDGSNVGETHDRHLEEAYLDWRR
jgi:hypothetical protein